MIQNQKPVQSNRNKISHKIPAIGRVCVKSYSKRKQRHNIPYLHETRYSVEEACVIKKKNKCLKLCATLTKAF